MGPQPVHVTLKSTATGALPATFEPDEDFSKTSPESHGSLYREPFHWVSPTHERPERIRAPENLPPPENPALQSTVPNSSSG